MKYSRFGALFLEYLHLFSERAISGYVENIQTISVLWYNRERFYKHRIANQYWVQDTHHYLLPYKTVGCNCLSMS